MRIWRWWCGYRCECNYKCGNFELSVDVDECGKGTHNCHVDSNCTNTKGSFYCTCHTGYSGDGVTCDGKLQSHSDVTY